MVAVNSRTGRTARHGSRVRTSKDSRVSLLLLTKNVLLVYPLPGSPIRRFSMLLSFASKFRKLFDHLTFYSCQPFHFSFFFTLMSALLPATRPRKQITSHLSKQIRASFLLDSMHATSLATLFLLFSSLTSFLVFLFLLFLESPN